jgi:beta-lactamase regulating signal transducer with metallopeptidase domain
MLLICFFVLFLIPALLTLVWVLLKKTARRTAKTRFGRRYGWAFQLGLLVVAALLAQQCYRSCSDSINSDRESVRSAS